MINKPVSRIRYFSQQFLRTEDFKTEQAYHLGMHRRHNIGHHIWGVVYGLELIREDGQLYLLPGLAVDGFGRDVILRERFTLPLGEFNTLQSDELDVWLFYNRTGSQVAPSSGRRCDSRARNEYNRWREEAVVRLEVSDLNYPDPRNPRAVAQAGAESRPFLSPPDDPARLWPIYLGRITRDRSDPAAVQYSIDQVGRPITGVVGDAVVSPSRRALLTLGTITGTDAEGVVTQTERFSVALVDSDSGTLREHLRIEEPGEVSLFGQSRLHGDLALAGSVRFGQSNANGTSPPADSAAITEPKPWRMYRHRESITSVGPGGSDVTSTIEQLRIEMAADNQAEVVIGSWSGEENAFVPVLTIANQGKVIVHKDLVVKGEITKDLQDASARLSPEAQRIMLSQLSSGIAGANLQLEKFYNSPFGGDIDLDSEEGQRQAVDFLVAKPDTRLSQFLNILLQNATARSQIIDRVLSTPEELLARMTVDGVGDYLNLFTDELVANHQDKVPVFCEKILDTEPGRTSVGTRLAEEPTARIPQTLVPILENETAREILVDGILSNGDGAATVGDSLTDPDLLGNILPTLLEDTNARDTISDALVRTAPGRQSIMNNLEAPPDPGADHPTNHFAALLATSPYLDRIPAFARQIMLTTEGRTDIGNEMRSDPSGYIFDTLAPVLDDAEASTVLTTTVIDSDNGPAGIGAALVANNDAIAATIAPVLDHDEALTALITTVIGSDNGPAGIGAALVANNDAIAATIAPVLDHDEALTALITTVMNSPDGRGSIGEYILQSPTPALEDILNPILTDGTDLGDNAREVMADIVLTNSNALTAIALAPDSATQIVTAFAANTTSPADIDSPLYRISSALFAISDDSDGRIGQISVGHFLDSFTIVGPPEPNHLLEFADLLAVDFPDVQAAIGSATA